MHHEYQSKWCTNSALWSLHGWYHMKQLLSWCMFCVHHAPVYSVTLFEASRCVSKAVICPLHVWQKPLGHDLLCSNTWENGYWNKSQHRELTLERKMCTLLGTEPWPFDHKWGTLLVIFSWSLRQPNRGARWSPDTGPYHLPLTSSPQDYPRVFTYFASSNCEHH